MVNADVFDCLALKSLHLSIPYCATGVVELTAAHAPNVKRVDAHQYDKSPYIGLTHLKALLMLKFHCCRKNGSVRLEAFTSWPLLESLKLIGSICARDLVVAYTGLKSLQIIDQFGSISSILRCPLLEHLKLLGDTLEANCVENIRGTFPWLKRLEIGR